MKRTLILAVVCVFPSLLFAQEGPIDWKTIATEFSQDAAAAQAKYQDKIITVTGPVSTVANGDMTLDDPCLAVTISSESGPGADVKCLFENSDLPEKAEYGMPDDGSEVVLRKRDATGNVISTRPFVQSGQDITVTGSYVNFDAGDIVLRHCRLVGGPAQ
jgi:hypothetical protein